MNKTAAQIFLLLILFCSCGDCPQSVSGTILDQDTKQPVDSVYIYNAQKAEVNTYSDNKGNFNLKSISGGLFRCPAMKIIMDKKGYCKDSIEIPNSDHSIMYLKRTH